LRDSAGRQWALLCKLDGAICRQKTRPPGFSHAQQSMANDDSRQPAFRFKSVSACDSRALSVAMNSIASISSRNSAAE
jgi:hypothetical protein